MAWDLLHDPDVGGAMKADELLKLARDAGFTEEQAQKLATARANARLDQEVSP